MAKSAAAAQSKPDPPHIDLGESDEEVVSRFSPEYQAAYQRWRGARQDFKELSQLHEELKTGLSLLRSDPPQERVKPLIAAFDQVLLARIRRSPRRAELELEELADRIIDGQDAYGAARQSFQEAKAAEAARIAETFRDQHAGAVMALAAAVEALSHAIAAERAVRAEYAKVSPEATSSLLPDMSNDFRELDLTRWDSRASTWARRVRQSGYLHEQP